MDHQFILLFTVIMAGTTVCTVYYVTPSMDRICEDKPCTTLTQFATNSSHYLDTTNTTLVLEPGNHVLNVNLMIRNVSQFAIVSQSSITLPVVTCSNFAKTNFINVDQVVIYDIRFVGCGENLFLSVHNFIVKNSTFMDHPRRYSGTVLQLIMTAATIIQSSFIDLAGVFHSISFGGAIKLVQSDLIVIGSNFQGNSATLGGALFARKNCNISILDTNFTNNQAICYNEICRSKILPTAPQGGALFIDSCNLFLKRVIFESNHASGLGGAIRAIASNVRTATSTFVKNSAAMNGIKTVENLGGGICSSNGSVITTESTFSFNMADYGGAIATQGNNIIIISNNTFVGNNAKFGGGALIFYLDHVLLISSNFINNTANIGGSIEVLLSSVSATSNSFINSMSYEHGAVFTVKSNISFSKNVFVHNFNGSLVAGASNITMYKDSFLFNEGENSVITAHFSTLTINYTLFWYNVAIHTLNMLRSTFKSYGIVSIENNYATDGVIYCDLSQADFSGTTTFINNSGSLEIVNSNATFNGLFYASNCSLISPSPLSIVLSVAIFNGISILENNQAKKGGAIYIVESRVFLYGVMSIGNNTATLYGGGLFLYKSELHFVENSTLRIYGNIAGTNGGGISAWSSSIMITADFISLVRPNGTFLVEGSSINAVQNEAERGGGMYLWNTNLYVLTYGLISNYTGVIVNFAENSATQYGGAIYVDDHSNKYLCSSKATEYFFPNLCFLQVLPLEETKVNYLDHSYIRFSQNYAEVAGSTIFGGLFDRCFVQNGSYPSGLMGTSFLKSVANNISLDTISSFPVRICFCKEHQPNCSYEHPPIFVMKGYPFTLSAVAVDQVNNTIKFTTIESFLSFGGGGLGIDQHTQKTGKSCTELTFNVFSPNSSTELTLLAQGPCGDALPSVKRVEIVFIPCSCPIGFQPTHEDETKCECDCDPELPFVITVCDPQQESLVREGNFWIAYTYMNSSDNSSTGGYIGYAHCPLDYCVPASLKVNVTLSKPNGSDMQCAFHRSGLLCGRCKPHYSISLGSSHCIHCSNNWLIPLIIMAALIGGLLLVAILLIVNLTVAKGTLNGIIFYANIVYANNSTFFQFPRPNFISVIIAWLNLEIGLDTCFYNGMDMYWKTWLQLAFSTYLLFLIIMIIVISERSTILSSILRRKNPVATLATLVLLSYTKLLHIVISVFSFAIIRYPDGSKKVVWLPDATLEYWSGKHIALFVTALAILLIGIFFTTVLFSWQWLLPRSDWRFFHWVKNQKLCMFVETYHAPYNFRHRYWTGLLLLVRIILSVVTAVNVSGDPAINLIANCVLLVMIIVLKLYVQGKRSIYKSILIDILESACVINLLTFSFFKLFFLAENSSQVFIAYLSGSIILSKFGLVLAYSMWTEIIAKTKMGLAIKNCREKRERQNSNAELRDLLDATSDEEDKVLEPTFTIIERPTPQKPLSELVEASNGSAEEDV